MPSCREKTRSALWLTCLASALRQRLQHQNTPYTAPAPWRSPLAWDGAWNAQTDLEGDFAWAIAGIGLVTRKPAFRWLHLDTCTRILAPGCQRLDASAWMPAPGCQRLDASA